MAVLDVINLANQKAQFVGFVVLVTLKARIPHFFSTSWQHLSLAKWFYVDADDDKQTNQLLWNLWTADTCIILCGSILFKGAKFNALHSKCYCSRCFFIHCISLHTHTVFSFASTGTQPRPSTQPSMCLSRSTQMALSTYSLCLCSGPSMLCR